MQSIDLQFQIIDISRFQSIEKTIEHAQISWSMSLASSAKIEKAQNDFEPVRSEQNELSAYFGSCAVAEIFGVEDGSTISAAEVLSAYEAEWSKLKKSYSAEQKPRRILFKTKRHGESSIGRYFDLDAIQLLYAEGILLVGVDTPSLQPIDVKQDLLETLLAERKAMLLNLDLNSANTGVLYNLIAPPMLVADQNLVPVRAILGRL